jgi:hypothetical protein
MPQIKSTHQVMKPLADLVELVGPTSIGEKQLASDLVNDAPAAKPVLSTKTILKDSLLSSIEKTNSF